LRSDTVRVLGSTTQTAGCRGAHERAAGISMPGAVELHAAADGGAEPHRRRRIDQADAHLEGAGHRVGARRDLAHAAGGGHRGSSTSATVISGSRRAVLDLRRHVEHRVAPALARHLDDHAARPAPPRPARPDARDHAGARRHQPRVAQPVLRQVDLRLRRLDLRLGASAAAPRPGRTARCETASSAQVLHALEVVARLDQLRLRRGQLRARRLQAALLVLRIEPGDQLARA
jgi:hypothetical protein